MKRRELLKKAGLGAGALILSNRAMATGKTAGGLILGDRAIAPIQQNPPRVLRIAHITDVHLLPSEGIFYRFLKCLEEIKTKTKDIDFFLNGGDSLGDVSEGNVPRRQVYEQWDAWKQASLQITGRYEMYSCLGNHDCWWRVAKSDPMYGEDYACKQCGMPSPCYSFNKKNWHFIILDSGGSMKPEQKIWLQKDLASLKANTPIIVMSHFPILGAGTLLAKVRGNHSDAGDITSIFYQHRDKKIYCLSGHTHVLDEVEYNGVKYFNNGAISGNWWSNVSKGPRNSNRKLIPGYPDLDVYANAQQTPAGYAILDLYEDGTLVNEYIPHPY